jgi:5-methylcytosine-specific restriction endonuclease McrA
MPARPLSQILVRGSVYNSNDFRLRLIREGVFVPACTGCLRTEWMGSAIPLEVDHRDGDRLNNELSNLRLLCPNCHALTPTYRGKNVRLRNRQGLA